MKIKVSKLEKMVIKRLGDFLIPKPKATIIFKTLLKSHLLGHPAHGLNRLNIYIKNLDDKLYRPLFTLELIKKSGACASYDGKNGIGILLMNDLVKKSISLNRRYGISIVTCKNCGDIARLGSYFDHFQEKKLIGILMATDSGANPVVALGNIAKPFFSTNPIAFHIPRNDGPSIITDMSTSSVAIGKIKTASDNNKFIDGSLIDDNGNFTNDPATFFKNPKESIISSLGHPYHSHKGLGLSLLVETIAGALAGSQIANGKNDNFDTNSVTLITINPEFLIGAEEFLIKVSNLCDNMKQISNNAVHIPGEKMVLETDLIDISEELYNILK